MFVFFFSSRRRHTRCSRDWSSDVCSSDLLRVVLFEIYRRYRLRLAPGATVVKNAVVTTKPAAVPVIRVPREVTRPGPGAGLDARPSAGAIKPDRSPPSSPDWGQPMEIPPPSAYRHVVIAYGSNFGASRSEERRVGKECRSRWSP